MTLTRRKDPNIELLEYECFAYKFEAEWQKEHQRLPGARHRQADLEVRLDINRSVEEGVPFL